MKTKRICKSTVSLILTLIMLVSMCTVAFVNVSAAETDTAQTGAEGVTVYFQNNWLWTDVKIHVWDSNNQALTGQWPGEKMTFVESYNNNDYYKYILPSDAVGFLFNGIKNDGSGALDKSPDIKDIPSNNTTFYYMSWDGGNKVNTSDKPITDIFPSEGGGTVAPTDPTVPTDPTEGETTPPEDATGLTKLYFMDTAGYMTEDDADIYAKFDNESKAKPMVQRIDTMSGKTLWNIKVPKGATEVTFTRKNKLGSKIESGEWNVPLSGKSTGYFKATRNGDGSWEDDESTFSPSSDSDIKNFWYGVWVDSKGANNGYDAVRSWNKTNTEYHFFLPSHTPSTFKLYTSFYDFSITGLNKSTSRGNYVELSNVTYDHKYSATRQLTSTSSSVGCSIYFHKSANVSSLLLFTDDQLWTDNFSEPHAYATPDGYKKYKDAIETSGSIYLYDEEGELLDDGKNDHSLKKIKGRGNSSFEASVKIYGKYAYNFNLNKAASLIDGATASKKWCLLANNVDHAMLRNTFVYNLAAEIGLNYSPKTRHVDVYDNGEYIGAYTITEKVEYGSETLMDGLTNLDKANEKANSVPHPDEDEDPLYELDTEDLVSTTGSYQGCSYKAYNKLDRPAYEDADGNTVEAARVDYVSPTDFKKMNFLLEFELHNRYENEAAYFVTPKKQAVVVKYPEYPTLDEMKWIIDQFVAVENAVYSDQYATYKNLIDVDSFAKVYLIQELGLNLDSCATSYYIHNQFTNDEKTTSKLVAGPVWDYDWSFGSYAKDSSDNTNHKLKPIFNGSNSNSLSGSLADPKQMFVKDKAIKTDIDESSDKYTDNYNLQAKLAHNKDFWEVCQSIWTGQMITAIDEFIDTDANETADTGTMIETWLTDLEASNNMNKIRWSNSRDADSWGTKNTDNYKFGDYKALVDYAYNRGSSGSSTSTSYASTVYYLNDWIATRMDYMSNEGGLYDTSSLPPYKLNGVTMTPQRNGNEVTISVEFDAEYLNAASLKYYQIDNLYKRFELYVNEQPQSGGAGYEITATPTVAINEEGETKIYVKAYLKDDASYNLDSKPETYTYKQTQSEYKIESVTASYSESADGSSVTVTPSAKVTLNGEPLTKDKYQYTIYNNGNPVATATNIPFTQASAKIDLVDGQNVIYVEVSIIGQNLTGNSINHTINRVVAGQAVTLTIKFKSSSSYRYRPTITYGDNDPINMTAGVCIGANENQTQKYYWYTADVPAVTGTPITIKFKNQYHMSAEYIINSPVEKEYYFGVDNLNSGTKAVDLSDYNTTDENDQKTLNFHQSAANMLMPDVSVAALACTSINGTTYKMGDTDSDDILSIIDATNTQLALARKTDLSATSTALADYNLDGVATIMDVTMVQMYLTQ